MQIRKAERKMTRIKMALQGSAGSGKTYSSLLIAFGLCNDWNKIVVIDTEHASSDLYSNLGPYNVLNITTPYEPEKYITAIEACEQAAMEVIIIDSISHCWDYLIEYHANMQGNSFTNWAKITPRQNAFINRMLQSTCHVIATMRVKQDYVLNQKDGKYIPEKVGLKAIQRDGVDYEFTIVFELNVNHRATASKDRTGLFFNNRELTLGLPTGQQIRDWCKSDLNSLEEMKAKIDSCENLEQLISLFNTSPSTHQDLTQAFTIKKNQLTVQLNNANKTNFKFNSNGSFTHK